MADPCEKEKEKNEKRQDLPLIMNGDLVPVSGNLRGPGGKGEGCGGTGAEGRKEVREGGKSKGEG